MKGVFIEGVEIPDNCENYICKSSYNYCPIKRYQGATDGSEWMPGTHRPTWCPMKEIDYAEAEWIINPDKTNWYKKYICSNCKSPSHINCVRDGISGGYGSGENAVDNWKYIALLSKYCPKCGAKMLNGDRKVDL